MKAVFPSDQVQNILFRPRLKETTVIFSIREEGKDEWDNYNHNGIFQDGFLTLGVQHPFKEDRQYQFIAYGMNNNILWRGKGYCTSQQPDRYKLHPELLSTAIPQATLQGGVPTNVTNPPEGSAAIADLQTRMQEQEEHEEHPIFEDLEELP